jgi:hypothetical protein
VQGPEAGVSRPEQGLEMDRAMRVSKERHSCDMSFITLERRPHDRNGNRPLPYPDASAGAALHADAEGREARAGILHHPGQERPHSQAFLNATRRFAAGYDQRGIGQLADVQAFHVAAFVKHLQEKFTQTSSSSIPAIVDRYAALMKAQRQSLPDLYVSAERLGLYDDKTVCGSGDCDMYFIFCDRLASNRTRLRRRALGNRHFSNGCSRRAHVRFGHFCYGPTAP